MDPKKSTHGYRENPGGIGVENPCFGPGGIGILADQLLSTPSIMNHLIVALGLLTLTAPCFAQDIIIKNNKEQIETKVVEVDEATVKYRLWAEKQDGPLYTMKKPDIFMIIYQSGRRETFSSEPVKMNAGAGAGAASGAATGQGTGADRGVDANRGADAGYHPNLTGFNPGNYQPSSEKLDVLRGATKMNVVFDYSTMVVNDMTEAEYIKKQMDRKGADADKWLTMWRSDRSYSSEPFFIQNFIVGRKTQIRLENLSEHPYSLVVKFNRIWTERAGVTGANAVVISEAYIVETEHPENIITKLGDTFTARMTGDWLAGGYALKDRLGGCYSLMAFRYAGQLKKQLKKMRLYR